MGTFIVPWLASTSRAIVQLIHGAHISFFIPKTLSARFAKRPFQFMNSSTQSPNLAG